MEISGLREHLVWFVAGGFFALLLARTVARWWRRLFWVAVTAAFALCAFFLLHPYPGQPGVLKTAWRAAGAAVRAISGLGGS